MVKPGEGHPRDGFSSVPIAASPGSAPTPMHWEGPGNEATSVCAIMPYNIICILDVNRLFFSSRLATQDLGLGAD